MSGVALLLAVLAFELVAAVALLEIAYRRRRARDALPPRAHYAPPPPNVRLIERDDRDEATP